MVYTSIVFIFGFLPIVLLGVFIFRNHIKISNVFLFVMSLLFYAWGEPKLCILLFLSILFNWSIALCIEKGQFSNAALTIAVLFNVGILFVFKYFAWSIELVNSIFDKTFPIWKLSLPIGISFYTFQALSYVIDVWKGEVKAQKNIINLGLYISLFPQLVAGPIVRYIDIEQQIVARKVSKDELSTGIIRFMMGFSKKILLADGFAVIVGKAFVLLQSNSLETGFAWLGAIAYTLQIFFDFSGYSDMAIGLGKMMGFSFNENFRYPYCATTITDFWRRWHISLSLWFRDYVYIPLGGNKKGLFRTCINLFIVWGLTGIWHGANISFLVWGVIYGTLIVFEKICGISQKLSGRGILCGMLYRIFTIFVIIVCWVIFRAENITQAFSYLNVMLWNPFCSKDGLQMMCMYMKEYKCEFIVGLLLCCPPNSKLQNACKYFEFPILIMIYLLFLTSISYIVKGTYSPFIYFNF